MNLHFPLAENDMRSKPCVTLDQDQQHSNPEYVNRVLPDAEDTDLESLTTLGIQVQLFSLFSFLIVTS